MKWGIPEIFQVWLFSLSVGGECAAGGTFVSPALSLSRSPTRLIGCIWTVAALNGKRDLSYFNNDKSTGTVTDAELTVHQ